MDSVSLLKLLAAFLAALTAGAINSVAGGGTMISFPVLLALGVPPILANATNTIGIWPGGFGSIWGFRSEFLKIPKFYRWLLVPCILGGLCGAILLQSTSPELFEKIVPLLIFAATILFIVSPTVRKFLQTRNKTLQPKNHVFLAFALQLGVAVYGGYFGAGMSILMLSTLALMGMTDMFEMTAMTSFLSLAVNGTAGLVFIWSGLIVWHYVAVMAVGAILGGYYATGIARRIGAIWIRRFVIFVGLVLAVVMLIRVIHT